MKTPLAVLSSKFSKKASRMIGKGGGNIPGVIARKIDKQVLKNLSKQVKTIILITGTNGKTTTSNLLASIFKANGLDFIHNAEGNNLVTGVTASFLNEADLKGKIKKDFAVIEVDERSMIPVLKEVKPKAIIINNFFRDQMNRIGEIDILVDEIKNAIQPVDTKLILNADDPFVLRFADLGKETIYFGMAKNVHPFHQSKVTESKFCPKCGTELVYEYIHYNQLGHFTCTCGFHRPKPFYEVEKIENDLTFSILRDNYKLKLSGAYNIYNAIGAVACARELDIPATVIQKGLESYDSNNGRMQEFTYNGKKRLLNLVKNHTGLDITLDEVVKDKEENKQLVLFLNDLQHDSEDISWIWDADIEMVNKSEFKSFICSGRRAFDMALRLKYAGIEEEKIRVLPTREVAIDVALELDLTTYFLPTYTALEPVKKYLEKKINEQ